MRIENPQRAANLEIFFWVVGAKHNIYMKFLKNWRAWNTSSKLSFGWYNPKFLFKNQEASSVTTYHPVKVLSSFKRTGSFLSKWTTHIIDWLKGHSSYMKNIHPQFGQNLILTLGTFPFFFFFFPSSPHNWMPTITLVNQIEKKLRSHLYLHLISFTPHISNNYPSLEPFYR